jgi:hypothetical protein
MMMSVSPIFKGTSFSEWCQHYSLSEDVEKYLRTVGVRRVFDLRDVYKSEFHINEIKVLCGERELVYPEVMSPDILCVLNVLQHADATQQAGAVGAIQRGSARPTADGVTAAAGSSTYCEDVTYVTGSNGQN